jgi:hypothetical protein
MIYGYVYLDVQATLSFPSYLSCTLAVPLNHPSRVHRTPPLSRPPQHSAVRKRRIVQYDRPRIYLSTTHDFHPEKYRATTHDGSVYVGYKFTSAYMTRLLLIFEQQYMAQARESSLISSQNRRCDSVSPSAQLS